MIHVVRAIHRVPILYNIKPFFSFVLLSLFCASLFKQFISGCPNVGTLSVQDVLTDLGAEEVDLFLGGKADRKFGRAVALPKPVVI